MNGAEDPAAHTASEVWSLRRCTQCGLDKPTSDFYRKATGRGGYTAKCKKCTLEYQRWRKANPSVLTVRQQGLADNRAMGAKRCRECGEVKPLGEYWHKPGTSDGLQNSCIACCQAGMRARRQYLKANPVTAPEFRRCPSCGAIKASTEYSKKSDSPSGLSVYCRVCYRERQKLQYAGRAASPSPPPESKRCPTCGTRKLATDFYRTMSSTDGLSSACSECLRSRKRGDASMETARRWKALNPDKMSAYAKRSRERILSTPNGALDNRMSTAIHSALRGGKAGRRWETLVGYSLRELSEHLETCFPEGIGWDNIGEWHIDHVLPRRLFRYVNAEDQEFRLCWSLENLIPLPGLANKSKSDRLPDGRRARDLSESERLEVLREWFGFTPGEDLH